MGRAGPSLFFPTPLGRVVFISVITTVRNEERNLGALLDSLRAQEPPFEVVIVDAFSDDNTLQLSQEYVRRFPTIFRLVQRGGTRGEGRNFGVDHSTGQGLAFIDGDCLASPQWLKELRATAADGRTVVAGKTLLVGLRAFADIPEIHEHSRGMLVGYPACNLFYPREVFRALGGFDPLLRTFEDVDLNYRAHLRGHSIAFAGSAIVVARAQDTLFGFLAQSFWSGYGRRQLELKHPALGARQSEPIHGLRTVTLGRLIRRAASLLGYVVGLRERFPVRGKPEISPGSK
jgi:glycosyltransferase involved in cell wall biosynthesis